MTLGGHDFYLGQHGSPESKAEYERRLGEWLVRGRPADMNDGEGPSINEVMLAYAKHVRAYYRGPNGEPTREIQNINAALKPLKELYGLTPARDFGPLALKTIRQHMIEGKLCRRVPIGLPAFLAAPAMAVGPHFSRTANTFLVSS